MAGVVALLALASVATSCGAVDVPDSEVSGAERRACLALVDALPHRVSELARRETDGNPLGAAWGDPAIVLRCGVGTPEGYQPTSPCHRVNGVDWFAPEDALTDQDEDVVLTTIGREPNVEITVPAEYRPPDATMVDVADAVKQHTEAVSPCP